ncbi:hypothetical protein X551_04699 [Methylibium sp. T29]|nr:hypothetical protein X551_04699 [Methylibium sp. T29]
MARHRRDQRREVLALAVAAEDHHQLGRRLVGAQTLERGHRGADVGALAVVVGLDAPDRGDEIHAVRLAAVLAQAVQHRRQRPADGGGQRQRGQRIGGVVAAADAQRVGRHQALQVDLLVLGVALAALDRLVGLQRAHQPGHAVLDHQPVVAGALRRVEPEADHLARQRLREAAFLRQWRRDHGLDLHVVAVDHHRAAPGVGRAVDARLRRGIGRHRAVPVEVVLRDVQHHRGVRHEAAHAVELEARQLQHPGLGKVLEHRRRGRRRGELQRGFVVVGRFGHGKALTPALSR